VPKITLIGGASNAAPGAVVPRAVERINDTDIYLNRRILVPADDPALQGFLGWAYDPTIASGNSLLGGGFEHLIRVVPLRDGRVTYVHVGLHSLGVTLTANQCWAGLRNQAGTLLGKTASQHTNWASGLYEKKMPLATPADVVGGVPVWVCFVANGSTLPGFARNSTSDMINAGCPAGQLPGAP